MHNAIRVLRETGSGRYGWFRQDMDFIGQIT
jgi:hypothetical protein